MKKENTINHSSTDFNENKNFDETNDCKFTKHPFKVICSYVPNCLFLSDGFIRCFGTKNYYNGWTSGIRNSVLNFKYAVQKIAATRYYAKMEKKVAKNRWMQPSVGVTHVCPSCGRCNSQSGRCGGGILRQHAPTQNRRRVVTY